MYFSTSTTSTASMNLSYSSNFDNWVHATNMDIQGILMPTYFPFDVGDTFYSLALIGSDGNDPPTGEYEILELVVDNLINAYGTPYIKADGCYYSTESLGKSIFRTKEEAEVKLIELKYDNRLVEMEG